MSKEDNHALTNIKVGDKSMQAKVNANKGGLKEIDQKFMGQKTHAGGRVE